MNYYGMKMRKWSFADLETLGGDKVSIITPTYPHIPRLTAHFKYGLMSDLVICNHRKEYGHT